MDTFRGISGCFGCFRGFLRRFCPFYALFPSFSGKIRKILSFFGSLKSIWSAKCLFLTFLTGKTCNSEAKTHDLHVRKAENGQKVYRDNDPPTRPFFPDFFCPDPDFYLWEESGQKKVRIQSRKIPDIF